MKSLMLLTAMLLLFAPVLATAQEGGDAMGGMPEMGRPAEMDKVAFMQGDWTVTVKMREGPDSEWIETPGTASIEPYLDGCANRQTFSSTFMGMPFNGLDLTTYNREEGRFESVWMDDMSGKFSVMHGNFDGDKLVMTGMDKMGGMEFMTRSVATKVSKDELHWSMEMSTDQGATWWENMQLIYKRKM